MRRERNPPQPLPNTTGSRGRALSGERDPLEGAEAPSALERVLQCAGAIDLHGPGMRGLPSARSRGTVLLLALVVVLVLVLVMGSVVTTTLNLAKSVQHELDSTKALALAEGVTEVAQKRLLEEIANFESPTLDGTVTLGSRDHRYRARPIGDPIQRTAPDGVASTVQHYLLTARVEHGKGVATVERVIDLHRTPIFQYMIFYDDDLELLPGPDMLLAGRVHANGDIYVGSGNTLTVDSEYFRGTGKIYRKRKNDGSESTGTVDIKVTGEDTYRALTNAEDAEYEEWATYALDRWNGTVQDGTHGVTEISSPDIGRIKAFQEDGSKGYYHENAGLVIVDGEAYDADGDPVDLSGALQERTFYDARAERDVTVTEVDMDLLQQSGNYPENGLIYAYRTDASEDQPNGVRLVNGEELGGPLSVVTEDPLYIQGDYNTVDKKPAAVLSDAVNLLSNGWEDSGGTMQTAEPTRYNVCMVTGNVPTPDGGGRYSGGFENLPRFLEDWNGVEAEIRGSFVNMYESEIATEPWGKSDVYRPPVRDWQFDPDILGNPPPFTPNGTHFKRVLWDDGLPSPLAAD